MFPRADNKARRAVAILSQVWLSMRKNEAPTTGWD